MKKYTPCLLSLISLLFLFAVILFSGCNARDETSQIQFATSAEYPPFEYMINGEIVGFDIDLAKLIAQSLGKKAVIKDMQFSTILPALQNGHVDAAIATITATPERKQQFDLSDVYHFDEIGVVYKGSHPIHSKSDLIGKKIACQLGSTLEIWLKKNGFTDNLITMDNNNQAIEALKANHVDAVLIDGAQGQIFSSKNAHLTYQMIEQSEDGYSIVTQKNSPLSAQINQALKTLKQNGEIAKLEAKWLKGAAP